MRIKNGTTPVTSANGMSMGTSNLRSKGLLKVNPIPISSISPPVEPDSDCMLPPPGSGVPKLVSVAELSCQS